MRIGFTYDLRDDYLREGYSEEETAEFDPPAAIDAIEAALTSLGHVVERVGNVKSLTSRLAAGDRWDLVFNYTEGLFGFAREAQVPALLDAFQIPYTFSDGLTFAMTLHKGFAKRVVRDLGIPTPDFVVISGVEEVKDVSLPFPLFVKPVAGGSSVGISAASVVADSTALESTCRQLLARFHQPVLVETFLPGRELTVGIVGTGRNARVLGVMEVIFAPDSEVEVYSFTVKNLELAHYRMVDDRAAREAAAVALRVWNGLGCRDAGRVDCRCDGDGRALFLEVNPMAGLHPTHSDLVILAGHVGVDFLHLIESIVASACERSATPSG